MRSESGVTAKRGGTPEWASGAGSPHRQVYRGALRLRVRLWLAIANAAEFRLQRAYDRLVAREGQS